jgi:hypothetical protein
VSTNAALASVGVGIVQLLATVVDGVEVWVTLSDHVIVTVAEIVLPAAGAATFSVNVAFEPGAPEIARTVPTTMAGSLLAVTVADLL